MRKHRPQGNGKREQPIASKSIASAAVCGLLVLAVIVVFSQSSGHGFVNYDDNDYAYDNQHVLHGLTGEGVVWAFGQSEAAAQWVPLTWLSLMTDVQMLGPNGGRPDLPRLAGRMHFTNIALHAAGSVLLFLVLLRLTGRLWQSAFVAAVFAIHPLHVESVAWVTERKDVLSALFGFLAIWAYAWYARGPSAPRYIAVMAALALGLMAKPILVTWPLVFLLIDYWPLKRQLNAWLLVEKVPLLVLAAIPAAITLFAHQSQGAVATLESTPLSERLVSSTVLYVVYLGKSVWPNHLAAVYTAVPFATIGAAIAAGLLLAVITAGTLLAARRGARWLAVGWLFYLVTLLPMIGLVKAGAQVMPDRSMYLPEIGMGIVVAWGAAESARRRRYLQTAVTLAAIFALSGLAVAAWKQTSYWKDSEALWRHTLDCVPVNAVAENHLGLALAKMGKLDEAIGHYQKAVEDQPDYAVAHFNLGLALAARDRLDEAIAAYENGLALKPKDIEARYRLSIALSRRGEQAKSIEQLKKVLELRPDHIAARENLADMYLVANRFGEAIEQYRRALQFDRNNAVANFNLGIALERSGKPDEAMQQFRIALRLANASNQKGLANAIRERIQHHR